MAGLDGQSARPDGNRDGGVIAAAVNTPHAFSMEPIRHAMPAGRRAA